MELPTEFTVTVTYDHLKNALHAQYDEQGGICDTCIMAQAVQRVIPSAWVNARARAVTYEGGYKEWQADETGFKIVDLFDTPAYPEEQARAYRELEAMLPVEVIFWKVVNP